VEFDNSAQVDALAKLPPEPTKPPGRSAWTILPRGIASGAGKVGAAIVEGVAAVSPSAEELRRNPGRVTFSSETLDSVARSARDYERSLRPDPATAGTAEQVVFGVTSGLTEAVAGAVIAGPIGAATALGVGEGAATTDDLQRQGVDDTTARQAGAVTGVVGAASVALPLFGPTLKATAGLYLAGGPGGFMAQQALTSQILERAGYDKIAEQFDPLDPLGLALSGLIPLPFAGYGAARNIRAARAQKAVDAAPLSNLEPVNLEVPLKPLERANLATPEQVDAAMVHNLTLLRDGHQFETPRPDVQPAVVRDGAWVSVKVDGGEVGGTVKADGLHITHALVEDAKQGQGVGVALYKALIDDAHAQGLRVFSDATVETPAARVYEALARRGYQVERLPGGGDLPVSPEAPAGGMYGKGAATPVFEVRAPVDPSPAPQPQAQTATAPAAPKLAPLADTIESLAKSPDPAIRAIAEGLRMAGKDIERLQRAIPGDKTQRADFAKELATAAKEMDTMRATGQTLDQFVDAKGDIAPALHNLLVGFAENPSPKRIAALVRELADASEAARTAMKPETPADVTANAVERLRTLTDEQLTNTEPDSIKASTDPLMRSVSERVAAVEMANPDMVIEMTDSGNPITVRDELARIRKEAFEGTDVELGAKDADLVSVAANCALTNGG
jgi:GNAT superfamily N-acetyltransferase